MARAEQDQEIGTAENGAIDEPALGAPIEVGADQVERLLADLNPPQREAVTHGEGPLLVLAGAGSGKTRVLTHRVAWLLATGQARPNEILAITFTNKAAEEMRERVASLVGGVSRRMWVMTFHAACARLLRIEAERLGYTSRFTIYDEADSLRMLKRCLEELEVDTKRYPPRAVRARISDAKNQLIDAETYQETGGGPFEEMVGQVYRALRAPDARVERDGLRRPPDADGERPRAVRGRPPPLPRALPLGPRRRVPGHQPRPVPAPPAALRRGRELDGGR